MSALNIQIATGETAVTATARTVITAGAPANQRVKIKGYSVDGKGTSNTDSPVKIEFIVAASISGGTAGTITASKMDGDMAETIQTTIAGNYSAEPTYTSPVTVQTRECHPQTSKDFFFPTGEEIVLKGGTTFGVRLTSVQNETMAVMLYLEE